MQYQRTTISEPFIAELGQTIRHGKSVMLLGPRYVGKRYILRSIREKYCRRDAEYWSVSFRLWAPKDQPQESASDRKLPANPQAVIDWLDERIMRPVETYYILFISDVEALPHQIARAFLKDLNDLLKKKEEPGARVAVLITGEANLPRLFEPEPPFVCDHCHVLQGFDLSLFRSIAESYLRILPFESGLFQSQIERAHEITGGNLHLLRHLIWEGINRKVRDHSDLDHGNISLPGDQEAIESLMTTKESTLSESLAFLAGLIDGEPKSWDDVAKLRKGEKIKVALNSLPSLVELAGVALYDNGELSLPPERLVSQFIQQRYNDRQFGDLYAKSANSDEDWDRAFSYYERVDPAKRIRPSSMDDVNHTDAVVQSLSKSLYRKAINGSEYVLDRFLKGCELAIGYSEVSHWECRDEQPVALKGSPPKFSRWARYVPRETHSLWESGPPPTSEYEAILKAIDPDNTPEVNCPEPSEQPISVVSIKIPACHPDRRELLLVGQPNANSITSKARRNNIVQLSYAFLAAYQHALNVELTKQQASNQQKLTEFANEISTWPVKDDSLSHAPKPNSNEDAFDKRVGQSIQQAADRFLKMDYSRVIIAMVDPNREFVAPVAMAFDKTIHKPVNWRQSHFPLDGRSGTSWVVKSQSRECLITRDAAKDHRVLTQVATNLNANAAAIVPLLDPREYVIGTIQIERRDGMAPTPDEVNDLKDFGRRIVLAYQISDQLSMYRKALNSIPTPLVLLNQADQLRFINRAASDRYETRAGAETFFYDQCIGDLKFHLQGAKGNRVSIPAIDTWIQEQLRKARATQEMIQTRISESGHPSLDTLGLRIKVEPIWDWRKGRNDHFDNKSAMTGMVLHVQPNDHAGWVVGALKPFLTADSEETVLRVWLDLLKQAEFPWARLYKFDSSSDQLISHSGFGFTLDSTRIKFEAGGFKINRPEQEKRWEAWTCFNEEKPVLFGYDLSQRKMQTSETSLGLTMTNCIDSECPEELNKEPEDLWFDIPLMLHKEPVGKLSVGTNSQLDLDRFWFLGQLCAITNQLLDHLSKSKPSSRQLRRADDMIKHYNEATKRHVANSLQAVKGMFTELSPAITRFRLKQERLGMRLRDLASQDQDPNFQNSQSAFQAALDEMLDSAERIDAVGWELWNRLRHNKQSIKIHDTFIVRTDLGFLIDELTSTHMEGVEFSRIDRGLPPGYYVDLQPAPLLRTLSRLIGQLIQQRENQAGEATASESRVTVTVTTEVFQKNGSSWVRIGIRAADIEIGPLEKFLGNDRKRVTTLLRKQKPFSVVGFVDRIRGEIRVEVDTFKNEAGFVVEFPRDEATATIETVS